MISRHQITRDIHAELEILKDRYERDQRKLVKRINQGSSVNLNGYKDTPLEFALFSTLNSDFSEVRSSLVAHVEMGVGHFQREFSSEAQVTIKLGEEAYLVDSAQKRIGVSLFDWWSLLGITLILREEGLRGKLLTFFEDSAASSGDPFWRRSTDLVLICLGEKPVHERIIENIKSIARSGIVESHGAEGSDLVKSADGRAIREALWVPIMELYHFALNNDSAGFNTKLQVYLTDKKEWIGKNGEQDNSLYWVDFPLLACCSYAHDRGIAVSVESDYIPEPLYSGNF